MSTDHIITDLDFTDDFEIRQQVLRDLEDRITTTSIDIRNALLSYTPNADNYQQMVIDAEAETIRVVAPAGSGKTQTVINRVLSQIRDGVNPSRILVVTFDNAAATSLTNHLNEIKIELSDLRISTLNSFGYWILREYFPKEFKPVIQDYRSRRLFKEVKEALKEKSAERYAAIPRNIKNTFFIEFFGMLKNELFDPRDINAQQFADFLLKNRQADPFFLSSRNKDVLKKIVQAIAWLFSAYERVMQREKLLDFDDQKLRAFLCLKNATSLLEIIQNSYSEIIVDEFQDINRLDFEFIKLIAETAKLMVTGDDDQAIYGFRGCTPDFIIDLEKYLRRQITSYELQINYRCPANIVKHADMLIRHNKRRIEKNPIPHNESISEIKVMSTLSAGVEAKSIVTLIKRLINLNHNLGYEKFAVLYRTNAQSLPLQIEFILNGLPYYVRKEDNILENEMLDKLMGVLRLKLSFDQGQSPKPSDAVSAVKAYFRYINPSQADRIERFFEENRNFMEIISSQKFWDILPKAKESKFVAGVQELVNAQSLMTCLDVLSKMFHGLEGMIGSLEDVIQEKVPLGEIYEIAANFGGNIGDFIIMMDKALNLARTTGAGKNKEGGVNFLTYFKSKGLQWHTVILTTCNEGLIPHSKAPVEDERRLFYVAMTRVTSNLILSYVKNSCRMKVAPSRFLYEAGLLPK